MIFELKDIMVQFSITNEAELFCSNLSFRMNDETASNRFGDQYRKEEDRAKTMTTKLENIKSIYKNKLKDLFYEEQ